MHKEVLDPVASRALVPELAATRNPNVWVYKYHDAANGWTLSIATHAEPGSHKLSLGGFRIAPESRTSAPGFTPDREAIGLAMGMEEKVHWSRVIKVGGPLAVRDMTRIVGGKCVLVPASDSRVGQPRDAAMLDWAVACLKDMEASAGIYLTTGQDLGHGTMFDGVTPSLAYLNARYKGSVVADTSKPTGEGNYQLLHGMLRALGRDMRGATVGLLGCGNIGMHMLECLRTAGATVLAMEAREERRAELEAMGIRTWGKDDKVAFLALPMDAVAVNAAGGTLDAIAVQACGANPRLRVVCGSENMVMPDAALALQLRDAGKVYAPTELGGMMGYLTAVEEYMAHLVGLPFDVHTLYEAAKRLEVAGFEATERVRTGGFVESFEDAVVGLYGDVV
ncbi:MAG: hypothetical protein NTZ43_07585 [Gemmatimonadetes bacterium]|nr:hypothetical protein [Gemmatimonadota bacterium]